MNKKLIGLVAILLQILACNKQSTEVSVPEAVPETRIEFAEEEPNPVDAVISSMTLTEKIGQLMIIQFRYTETGGPVTILGDAEQAFLQEIAPGGVILFRENIETLDQTLGFTTFLMEHSPYPLFIAVDEEGGLVSRLTRSGKLPATHIPSAQFIGETGSTQWAYDLYRIIAEEMRALGLNMNFAPVADVLTVPNNPVILTRSFGEDPEKVSLMVASAVRGLQDNGVVSVVKHFPGHGDSSQDSHTTRVVIEHNLERLESTEFLPFQSAIQAGAKGIMTAHLYFPNIDGGSVPASLSKFFLSDILRDAMNFNGLIITDALEMGGLRDVETPEDAGLTALSAGADMLLIPPDPRALQERILEALDTGTLSLERLEDSVARIIEAKMAMGIWDNQNIPERSQAIGILGSEEHTVTSQEPDQAGP